jgi:gentisate 1,2-dioxygenase
MTANGVNSTIETVDDVIRGASKYNAVPLWPQMVKYNPPKPNPKCIPHIWRYNDVRPYLLKAGELVKEKDAERRVLMLINPKRGECCLTRVRGGQTFEYNRPMYCLRW